LDVGVSVFENTTIEANVAAAQAAYTFAARVVDGVNAFSARADLTYLRNQFSFNWFSQPLWPEKPKKQIDFLAMSKIC